MQHETNPSSQIQPVSQARGTRSRTAIRHLQDIAGWDAKSGRAASFRLACPSFRPMGDFIEEATELVRPADEPDKDWPVYGVNNKEGVFLNSHQKGATFNAPYKRIRKDWFFHNPTRCNVGSLGIVPDVPADAITSPEYQVWRLKSDIPTPMLPAYIACLIQTPFFLDLVQFNRVGAVKQRMYTENLMQRQLTRQGRRRIVTHMKTTLDIADELLRHAKRVSRERGVTLRELVSEGLLYVIEKKEAKPAFHAKAVTFGGKGLAPEFRQASWGAIRDAAYEGHGADGGHDAGAGASGGSRGDPPKASLPE